MIDRPPSLLIAPTPFLDESPASWIQRVCQKHSLPYRTLLGNLGIPPRQDPDVQLPVDHICHIGRGTAVPLARLRLLGNVFRSIRELPRLGRLLSFAPDGEPSYRVCFACLRTDAIPYLRIQWRFKDWGYCPIHHVPLSERCAECGAPVVAAKVCIGRTADGKTADISDCANCRKPLVGVGPAPNPISTRTSQISAQMSIVSAVIRGYFYLEGFPERMGLDFLLWLDDKYHLNACELAPSKSINIEDAVASSIVRRLLRTYRSASSPSPHILRLTT
ncbi:hypothetical protein C0Z18_23115 [Trinickia dabaoshanensis]|uniref:TniQ domain-containing protein n=1 Tax=Trinickia dabaoshanensis TaxID=564714 RepID=A0A2N7VH39_9BURK|nr:hypothetical protein C0Z18_23115 [Trinickia dabaoshanensis]